MAVRTLIRCCSRADIWSSGHAEHNAGSPYGRNSVAGSGAPSNGHPGGNNTRTDCRAESVEPQERLDPPVQHPKREPPAPRKKPVPVPKPVLTAPVSKASPDSDTSSNKPPETADESQAASPAPESVSAGSSPSDDSAPHSGGRNVGGHDHAVESSVGAMGGPQFIQRSVPKYPRMAQRLGVEGSVLLRLAIDASGKLTGVEVVNGAGNGFDEEAVQAVKRSTFAPAVRNGRPVRCLALLKIRFQLSNE